MARRKRSKVKPGRETASTRQRRKALPPATKPSAATRLKQYNSIVSDRVGYLRSIAAKTVTFKDNKRAKKFASQLEKETGLVYTVRGKKATLAKVDRNKVKSSSELKRILNDLKGKTDSARGKKAKALQELGRRESWYDFAVGDTNE